jgi:hypothetical protein
MDALFGNGYLNSALVAGLKRKVLSEHLSNWYFGLSF